MNISIMPKLFICSFLFLLSFSTFAQKSFEVKGIDISRWQGVIDWEQVKRQDIDFVFVKATQGKKLKDPNFKKNWKSLRKANIPRGAYHFFTTNRKGRAQARKFLRVACIRRGDLPPVIDVEKMGDNPLNTLIELKKCLEIIERRLNVRPIIYANQNYYNKYLKDSFPGYVLWIARYSDTQPNVKEWQFWQYSNKGRIEGIQGDVDLNYFKGSYSDLQRLLIR